jgi:hypothetical protein
VSFLNLSRLGKFFPFFYDLWLVVRRCLISFYRLLLLVCVCLVRAFLFPLFSSSMPSVFLLFSYFVVLLCVFFLVIRVLSRCRFDSWLCVNSCVCVCVCVFLSVFYYLLASYISWGVVFFVGGGGLYCFVCLGSVAVSMMCCLLPGRASMACFELRSGIGFTFGDLGGHR